MIKILHELKCVMSEYENMTRTMGTHKNQKEKQKWSEVWSANEVVCAYYFEMIYDEFFESLASTRNQKVFIFIDQNDSNLMHVSNILLFEFSAESTTFIIGKFAMTDFLPNYSIQSFVLPSPSIAFLCILERRKLHSNPRKFGIRTMQVS